MFNINWPTTVAGEADNVSSMSASACHIGGPIDVNPGESTLVYGSNLNCSKNLDFRKMPTDPVARFM